MNAPSVYQADFVPKDNQVEVRPGRWALARPIRYQGRCLRYRLAWAWRVFRGQADVLVWAEDCRDHPTWRV